MADIKDTLAARRWFRQRLADLAIQYPQLTTPAAQERLAEALVTITKEDTDHGENSNRQAQGEAERDREAW